MDKLIWETSPTIWFAKNEFVNVPIILQYDDTPLIEVQDLVKAGFTTRFQIYHSDGTYLAKVKGARCFPTKAGSKAGITVEHPAGMTVCKVGGRVAFELSRSEAAALKTDAELYTPDGSFIRCHNSVDAPVSGQLLGPNAKALQVGGLLFTGNNRFEGCAIGIHVKSDGTTSVGVGAQSA